MKKIGADGKQKLITASLPDFGGNKNLAQRLIASKDEKIKELKLLRDDLKNQIDSLRKENEELQVDRERSNLSARENDELKNSMFTLKVAFPFLTVSKI